MLLNLPKAIRTSKLYNDVNLGKLKIRLRRFAHELETFGPKSRFTNPEKENCSILAAVGQLNVNFSFVSVIKTFFQLLGQQEKPST